MIGKLPTCANWRNLKVIKRKGLDIQINKAKIFKGGENMKKYNKPVLSVVELKAEEKLATCSLLRETNGCKTAQNNYNKY